MTTSQPTDNSEQLYAEFTYMKELQVPERAFINHLHSKLKEYTQPMEKIVIFDFMLGFHRDDLLEIVLDEIKQAPREKYTTKLYFLLAKYKHKIGIEYIRDIVQQRCAEIAETVHLFNGGFDFMTAPVLENISERHDISEIMFMLTLLKKRRDNLKYIKKWCENISSNIDKTYFGYDCVLNDRDDTILEERKKVMKRVKYLMK